VAELARGGMGVVWLAERLGPAGFAKRCVVKELLPELEHDPRMRSMFLAHRNVVQTNDFGVSDGRWFMALELLEGVSLARLAEIAAARLRPALAVRIVCEVLAGLDHAHELQGDDGRPLGVVHRDVSPRNVFVTLDGEVKLLDFGVARSDLPGREPTRPGFAKGCVAYMSPDHVARAPIDRRADVFAAGVVLRELLTCARLWGAADDRQIVCDLIAGRVPSLEEQGGRAVGPALRRLCEVATAAARDDRFASARHMRRALEAWLSIEDPDGSLAELAMLFAQDLSAEAAHVREALRAGARAPEPTVELRTADLETAPPPARPARRAYPWREAFVAAMALVAMAAAGVAVAANAADPSPPAAIAADDGSRR